MKSDDLSLWGHQKKAIDICQAYLKTDEDSACLIQHPTGTGKTGIMAVLARLNSSAKPVIVICPSDALVEQLRSDLSERFWSKIKAADEWKINITPRLTRNTLEVVSECIESQKNVVVFTTPQALRDIYNKDQHSRLINKFSCALFDEGHREPSAKWAEATRMLGCKIILFSATPYRNDLKLFNINKNYHHFLSFQDAVREKIIRDIEFIYLDFPGNFEEFARKIISERENNSNPDTKVIIRTDSKENVEALYRAFLHELKGKDCGVIAVHSAFTDETDGKSSMLNQVPDKLSQRKEKYLIHQYMLIEGIDDPGCGMLVLHRSFSNERSMVQQIGRVVRTGSSPAADIDPAKIYITTGSKAENLWRRFIDYNSLCHDTEKNPLYRQDSYIKSLVNALPEMDYQDKRFRKRVNFNSPDLSMEIRVPLTATVYNKGHTVPDTKFLNSICELLEDDDRYIAAKTKDYILSLRINQSALLSESLFQMPSLEITLWRFVGKKLFFYDSAGLWIDHLPAVGRRISANEISRLLPDNASTKVKMLNMKNTDLGAYSLRGKTLQANSLEYSGVFIGEHMHVINRTQGYTSSKRRILSHNTARINEGHGIHATLDEYTEWCKGISKELNSRNKPSGIFTRFASQIKTPADLKEAKNILIDADECSGQFEDINKNTAIFDPESICCDITSSDELKGYNKKFEIKINEQSIPVWIQWDKKKEKYWIKSPKLSQLKDKNNPNLSLTQYINRRQAFRIILDKSPGIVFSSGRFYEIELKINSSSGPGALVLGLLSGHPQLGTSVTSEKGELIPDAQEWTDKSAFDLVDREVTGRKANNIFGDYFDNVVCDDQGDEVADFICMNCDPKKNDNRIAFIAVKWKAKKPGAGASGLYDVCGQALKNLAYIKIDGRKLPGLTDKWDKEWTLTEDLKDKSGKKTGQKINGSVPRKRKGLGSAYFRDEFNKVRSLPGTRREFWLVLTGGILSKDALRKEFGKKNPAPHSLQALHLLLAVYSACQSVGVELKIFCAK